MKKIELLLIVLLASANAVLIYNAPLGISAPAVKISGENPKEQAKIQYKIGGFYKCKPSADPFKSGDTVIRIIDLKKGWALYYYVEIDGRKCKYRSPNSDKISFLQSFYFYPVSGDKYFNTKGHEQ